MHYPKENVGTFFILWANCVMTDGRKYDMKRTLETPISVISFQVSIRLPSLPGNDYVNVDTVHQFID